MSLQLLRRSSSQLRVGLFVPAFFLAKKQEKRAPLLSLTRFCANNNTLFLILVMLRNGHHLVSHSCHSTLLLFCHRKNLCKVSNLMILLLLFPNARIFVHYNDKSTFFILEKSYKSPPIFFTWLPLKPSVYNFWRYLQST
jgi:hypothetical protein